MSGLVFHADSHVYELDREAVPSVTGVLKASGLINFDHIPPRVLEAALARGNTVHRAIHYWNEKDLDVDVFRCNFPPYAGYLNAWINFCAQRSFTAVLNEHRIVSRRHGVAGTLDCLGVLDGVGALLDFKTGNPDDVSCDLQSAAYEGLAREWASEDLRLRDFFVQHPRIQRFGIQLKRDGQFRVDAYKDPRDWSEFVTLVTARRIVEARKGEAQAWMQGAA